MESIRTLLRGIFNKLLGDYPPDLFLIAVLPTNPPTNKRQTATTRNRNAVVVQA